MRVQNCMWQVILILKISGGIPPPVGSKWRNIYFVYSGICQIFFGSCFVASQFINIFTATDFQEMAYCMYMSIEHSAAMMKIFLLLFYSKTIAKMLDTMDSKLFTTQTKQQKKFVRESAISVRNNTYGYLGVLMFSCLSYVISPLLEHSHKTPFPGWAPQWADESPYFELLYIWQSFVLPFGALLNSTIDLLIAAVIIIACCQFDVLMDCFTNIYQSTLDKNQKNANHSEMNDFDDHVNSEVYKELVLRIHHHSLILEYIEDIDEAFKWSMLAQFSCSSLVICLNVYYLSTITKVDAQFFALISFTSLMLTQLFLYCWYGNKVYFKSMDLIDAIYLSDWYKCGSKIRQAICLVMVRCRRPVKITAGNFVPVQLETFLNIVKTAYTAFTLLQNMNDEEQ